MKSPYNTFFKNMEYLFSGIRFWLSLVPSISKLVHPGSWVEALKQGGDGSPSQGCWRRKVWCHCVPRQACCYPQHAADRLQHPGLHVCWSCVPGVCCFIGKLPYMPHIPYTLPYKPLVREEGEDQGKQILNICFFFVFTDYLITLPISLLSHFQIFFFSL